MSKIGIIICNRERTCTGGKCFMAVKERVGVFRKYPKNEPLDVVGFITCGGCPGERLERAPADLKNMVPRKSYSHHVFLQAIRRVHISKVLFSI